MSVRVLLADGHPIVRLGIRELLERVPDVEVVGEADDGLQVVPQVEALRPDVLVLDLIMPSLDGLEIIRRLARRAPKTRVVVLSMHANEAYVAAALRNGAQAYVLKGADARQITDAVGAVMNGRRYLSPPLSMRSVESSIKKGAAAAFDVYETLTAREREVFQLMAEGRRGREIGARLFISLRTVESHRASVLRKLGLRTQTEIVRYALRRGLVPLDD